MKNYFSFGTDRYDFWPEYDAIKKYYPLGLLKDYDSTYGFDQWLIDNPDFTDYWTV